MQLHSTNSILDLSLLLPFILIPKKFCISMASSSSSSHLIPASTSQSLNHDVFLSFRGEDTRRNFVDHLYATLVRQDIRTYKDDETLARGESIGPALLKAIRESQIAVVIFSENYADSSWCLDELTCIIEGMDRRGQIVMPVFYNIDPSHVRKQDGKYGEAFEKHERENKHKVESWREALVKAGNLSGWVTEFFANGHEAKCIEDIVNAISDRLAPQTTTANKDLIGIESRLVDLKSKLEIVSGGVRTIGIWGVGGGGKTTLASAAYMEISHQFEAHCFLANIRDESSKIGLKRLQETFLSLVLKKNVKLGSEDEGRRLIERRLCRKRVLVVLDDVDNPEQLNALAGSHDWFGEGSRIIITTRDKHLLSRKADMIYEVSLLSRDEAMELFRRHAYREDEPVEDYEVLSLIVVSYAHGLPLALEVLGSFLYDKDNDEWKSLFTKLEHIPEKKVTERLKISYDGLKPEEKDLFLDIACYMRRRPQKEAMEVLDACGFHSRIGIKVLVQKSLIKISDGKLDIHDLIEEMAHYIVRGEHPNNPEKHSRIWQENDLEKLCAMEASTLMENEALQLSIPNSKNPSFPNVIANMKKLRWISWYGHPASSFPTNFQPRSLGFLKLGWTKQKQLWKGCKHLPNLKVLVVHSKYLISTPDFGGLPCLETLNLEYCGKLVDIHPSIGFHERLVVVNMKGCVKVRKFPPIVRMEKLKMLTLTNCYRLKKFPDIQTNMDSLERLSLENTDIDIVPPSVVQFCTNLVYLNVRDCHRLERIEGNFRLLKLLKVLHVSVCSELPWDFFDRECCLEVFFYHINSEDSTSSKNLMNRIGLKCFHQERVVRDVVSLRVPQLPRFIRKLNLSCHLGDGDIPPDMSALSNLKVLDLRGNDFTRLHSSLSGIPCLKILILSSCKRLVELPDLPSTIAILKANHCDSLESVGDLSRYKELWNVSLRESNGRLQDTMLHDRAPHSMLQGAVAGDRFMSLTLPLTEYTHSTDDTRNITLQLPHNWHCDFLGFLLCNCSYSLDFTCTVVIMQARPMDSQPADDHFEVFDKNATGSYIYSLVGYLPFVLLRNTPWWNSASTEVSFQIQGMDNPQIGLVPKRDSRETTIDYVGTCYEDEDGESENTLSIQNNSKSSNVEITWWPYLS